MRLTPLILLYALSAGLFAGQYPEIPPSTLATARMASDDGQDPMGRRLFQTTTTRRQINLAGWWEFVADPKDEGETRRFFAQFPAPDTMLWVPGSWNSQARYWNYVGAGWYRRRMQVPESGDLRLVFSGVFYYARVWVDGQCLGEHEGSYLPFSFLVKGVAKGAHTIVVRADNRLSDSTLPKRNVDWFPYGGIDRPVYAELVPETWIERFDVESSAGGGVSETITVRAVVRNGAKAARPRFTLAIDGQVRHTAQHDVPAGGGAVEFTARLESPRLWSPEEPNLYSARLTLDDADDQFTRFGVRSIAVRGAAIYLNGRPLKVRGVNRHEDHPDWGSAMPPHLLRQDVEIIKRLGANAVRAHYPMPDMFVDYCDQNGLLYLSEVPAWQYRAEQLASAEIQRKILGNFEQMVERDWSHPSVFSWSLGNEWPNPDQSYDVIKSLVEFARRVDGGRHIITFVTGGPSVRRVQELVDVICVNWAQYQWYDPITYLDREEGAKSIADLRRIHERYPAKPVILTEFGGAESQAGWHNWGNVKWSEEFQARNVGDSGRESLAENWLAGGCVWQFCDARSAPERVLAGRLHGWNGKGVVDAYRNPKLAYYALQELFRSWQGAAEPAAR